MSAVERAARAICASENEIWDEASQASRDRWMREASADIGKPISGLLICDGCGCTTTDAELAAQREARPGLISCCPERKMHPATREDWDKLRASKDAAPVSAGKVKALVWEEYGEDCLGWKAPLFGAILVKRHWKGHWVVVWSTPGYTEVFVPGHFDTPEAAKAAAESRILSALQPGDGWQDISSAPKDGTRLLAFQAGRPICEVWWDDVSHDFPDWNDDGDGEPRPTHWMPLPASPASLPQGEETR